MTRLRYAPLLIGLVGFGQLASASDGQSVLFEHNGSQVRLDVRAGAAIMRYVEPRPAFLPPASTGTRFCLRDVLAPMEACRALLTPTLRAARPLPIPSTVFGGRTTSAMPV
jgi:hypothetical protein